MNALVIAASLSLVLSGAVSYAQAPAAQTPASTAPAAAQPPAPTAPATPPALQFPQGAKLAYVNIQRVVAESAEGKISSARVQALIQKKQNEGTDKQKQLAANQAKLEQSGNVMSAAARSQLEKDIEKLQVEGQRFQQDAQAEITDLQTELQTEFQKKLVPILQQVATEKGLQVMFSLGDSGLAWADPSLDLTIEVIRKFDGATAAPKPAAAPRPTATPAKPPVKP